MPDNTKHQFEGNEYGKGQLALTCIASMVSDSEITVDSLTQQFVSVSFNGDVIIDRTSYEDGLEQSPLSLAGSHYSQSFLFPMIIYLRNT